MLLPWVYIVEEKLLKCIIDDDLFYITVDGGKTIEKFYKTEKVLTLLQTKNIDNKIIDEWGEELKWLVENYSHIVGNLYSPWLLGYKERDGSIKGIGQLRGQGIVSPDNPISLDRLGIPANISEWWDYDCIAFGPGLDEASYKRGIVWYKHKTDGTYVRTSAINTPYPNDNFPEIHGPYVVNIDDIKKHGGVFYDEINCNHFEI